jgi:ketosteroid isomerase-like protein
MKFNNLNKFGLLAMIMLIMVSACSNRKQVDNSNVLKETDRYYSKLSAEKGMNASFLEMFDSTGVMLNENHKPIEGYHAIREVLLSRADSTFTLTWEPMFAKLAISGELGYTYGTYQVTSKPGDSIVEVGKYATIWLKQSDGKWKAILDTGNSGLGK